MPDKPATAVGPDPDDLRDRIYQPTLRPLPARLDPQGFYASSCEINGENCYKVRHQGKHPACTGMALAHLIDMNLYEAAPNGDPPPVVSARMLYEMARRQDKNPPKGGVSSLRAAIKGFYHYGVCPEDRWRFEDETATLDRKRAKAAREVTLGAYYRVRPYLNDYHAALNDAKALLVSADIHSGWSAPQVSNPEHRPGTNRGVIGAARDSAGGHAFVIVGYNDEGFLVLNSWGPNWGGYDGYPGIALWRYDDWSARVMDAWVLRLGVRAPNAFSQSVGHKGIFFDFNPIRSGSSACHELLGHFAHLDDGAHVEHGNYFSNQDAVVTTTKCLAASKRPLILMIPGSLLGMKRAFDVEVRRKPAIEKQRIQPRLYPYTLFWCNDFVDSSTAVLTRLFEEAMAQAGPSGPALDAAIERATHGIGRAFWRDVKHCAEIATQRDANGVGDAAEILDKLLTIPGVDVHLVIEGAGAVLFREYLLARRARGLRDKRIFDSIASFHLVTPTLEAGEFAEAYEPLVRVLRKREVEPKLWVPTRDFERKLRVGVYSKSILHLVLYGFEGADARAAPETRRTYIGMSKEESRISHQKGAAIKALKPEEIKEPKEDLADNRQIYSQDDVSLNPGLQELILKQILKAQRARNRERKHSNGK